MKNIYTQVLLTKGPLKMVGWIPSEFAILNAVLKLEDGEVWTNGWIVSEIYNSVPISILEFQKGALRDYQKTLEGSDE